ncbi:hypothetical protein HPB48_026021 [Haemaphysalis longicornis]|uniref:Uncharacterized protein n=1 Tax=Haemaphysalis longicornis TaxID=44386 RepID=A0A9J6H8H2_HAELO|nr:hypothetical protein HPB48_026021 [Haemaphysalis longicornis]
MVDLHSPSYRSPSWGKCYDLPPTYTGEKGKENDQVVLNNKQGTITYRSPRQEKAPKVLSMRKLPTRGKAYAVTSNMAALENSGRGVAHGIDLRFSEEKLEVGFCHRTNPHHRGA